MIEKKLMYATNGIQFSCLFHQGAYSHQRRIHLLHILDRCASYILLPPSVTVHLNSHRVLYTIEEDGTRNACAGLALPLTSNGQGVIVIAKRSLREIEAIIPHELGHVEHFFIHPESSGWMKQQCENYANTLEWYFDRDFQVACAISRFVRFDNQQRVLRYREIAGKLIEIGTGGNKCRAGS